MSEEIKPADGLDRTIASTIGADGWCKDNSCGPKSEFGNDTPAAWMCAGEINDEGWISTKFDSIQAAHSVDGKGEIIPLYAIPATHRIVPAELLEDLHRLCTEQAWWTIYREKAQKLQAIIDKEPT